MKLSLHMILQGCAVGVQLLTVLSGLVPTKYVAYVVGGIAFLQWLMSYLGHISNPDGTSASTINSMRIIIFVLIGGLFLAGTQSKAQTVVKVDPNTVPAFSSTTFNFNVSSINLFGKSTLAGVEADILVNVTANNLFGASTFTADNPFVGARYERVLPQVSAFIQNHTNFQGSNIQPFLTVSAGDINSNNKFGGRLGFGFHYAPAGSTTYGIGLDAEINYLPGIVNNTTRKWYPTIAVSPLLLHF